MLRSRRVNSETALTIQNDALQTFGGGKQLASGDELPFAVFERQTGFKGPPLLCCDVAYDESTRLCEWIRL